MAWATAFISALQSPAVMVRWALARVALWDEYAPVGDPFAVLSVPGDPVMMADWPGASTTTAIDVGEGAVLASTEQALDMRACRGGGSGLTVQIVGDPGNLRLSMVQLPLGAAVTLVAYVSDDDGATWYSEDVFLGRVQSMRRVACRLDVDVLGIDAALSNRPSGTASIAGRILAETGGTPTMLTAAGYTSGATDMHTTSPVPWTPTSPAKGVILVADSTPFAVTYSGVATAPDRATGLASVSTVSTSASALAGSVVVDTFGRPVASYKERVANDPPLSNVGSGTEIRFPAYYNGHPIAALRRLLTSRGTLGPANGADDVLPWSWSLGVDRDWLDITDMAAEEAGTSGALLERLELIRSQSAGADGAAFVDELAAQAGFFVAHRQGRLTVRAVPNPYASGIVSLAVTEQDLAVGGAEVTGGGEGLAVEHDPWPAAFPAYRQVLYVSNAAGYHVRSYTYAASIQTTAVEGRAAVVLTDRWGPHGASDSAVVEAGDRLAPSQMAVPELFRLPLRGLGWARLAKGDFVSLTLPSEIGRQSSGLVDGWLGVVLSVSVDWLAAVVTVEVVCFNPDHDPEDPDIIDGGDVYTGGQD